MYLGIDISKLNFDAALLETSTSKPNKPKHKAFPNTPAGFERLAQWLADNKVHACMEATNTYGDALARFLYERGHTVSVVCPGGHDFVSTLLRSKPSPRHAPPEPRPTKPMPLSSPASA